MKSKNLIVFLILTIVSSLIVYFVLYRPKKIFLDNSIQKNVIVYVTKNAIIYFDKKTVSSYLTEKINSAGAYPQDYDELFLQKIDSSLNNIKVYRIGSFKATLNNFYDTIDNPEVEFYKNWLNSIDFEEDHNTSRYSMEWLSLELIKKGEARIYNKKTKKDELFVYFKEYDNGLSWGEEYHLSNDQLLIKAMIGIR